MSPDNRPIRRFLPARWSQPGGFTLLELLVVTGLLTLLTAISWPSIRRSMSRASHDRAVDEVIEALAEARSRSVADGRMSLVHFDPLGRRLNVYQAVFDEVGPAAFLAGSTPGSAASALSMSPSSLAATSESADAQQGDDDAQLESAVGDQRSPLPDGVGWRRSTTLKLPEGVWYRVVPVASPFAREAADQRDLSANLPTGAASLEATSPPGATPNDDVTLGQSVDLVSDPSLRLLFGVAGTTADVQLQVCNVSGLCTTISLDGALGVIHKGETRRQKVTQRDPVERPVAPEDQAP